MTTKSKFIKIALSATTAIAVSAYALYPKKPVDVLDQPQIVVQSNNYKVETVEPNVDCKKTLGIKRCSVSYKSEVRADDVTSVYVEYTLDDASIDSMGIISVSRNGSEINAYVDQDEIQKINAAIVGGGK